MAADVGKELFLLGSTRGFVFGREKLFVMGDRKFHVHVQAFTFGEVKCEVRPVATFSGLFVEIFSLQHSKQIEDIFNHPFAPLAAGLAAGKNLAQLIGGLGQIFNALGGTLHLAMQPGGALVELQDRGGDVLQAGVDQFLFLV